MKNFKESMEYLWNILSIWFIIIFIIIILIIINFLSKSDITIYSDSNTYDIKTILNLYKNSNDSHIEYNLLKWKKILNIDSNIDLYIISNLDNIENLKKLNNNIIIPYNQELKKISYSIIWFKIVSDFKDIPLDYEDLSFDKYKWKLCIENDEYYKYIEKYFNGIYNDIKSKRLINEIKENIWNECIITISLINKNIIWSYKYIFPNQDNYGSIPKYTYTFINWNNKNWHKIYEYYISKNIQQYNSLLNNEFPYIWDIINPNLKLLLENNNIKNLKIKEE